MSELRFLGVDLSTLRQAQQGKTCIAVADGTPQGIRLLTLLSPPNDEALLEILQNPFALCGVDAPLSLPPCATCRDLDCACPYLHWVELLKRPIQDAYHYRLSDLVVRAAVPSVSPKPPLSTGGPVDITPLTMRWQRLARSLIHAKIDLRTFVEVYAMGAIQLYARAGNLTSGNARFRYRADQETRGHFLSYMEDVGRIEASDVLKEQLIASEDALDAVMAALSAWHAYHRTVLLPEDLLGLTPTPRPEFRSFAWLPQSERQAMSCRLYQEPWVMLPDLFQPGDPTS